MSLNTVATFLAAGSLIIGAVVLIATIIGVAARWSNGAARAWESLVVSAGPQGLWLAWAMALVATLGSLYFSEVAHLTPCTMCWYQRIAMYPWAIVLGVMAWHGERRAARYVLPVVLIGGAISTYHYLLQRYPDLLPDTSCSATVPCSSAYIWKFDLVSIPFMAGVSFATITLCILLHRAWLESTGNEHDHRTMTADPTEVSP